ncbi:hypothetical protein GGS26DRAFT_551396 [Hypomontagnella submonticulosa]|nr:hypothetical protein GGS26DRAFT_551396 [Hypomontagnella submonticulosa]
MELTPINVRGKRRRGDAPVVALPPKPKNKSRTSRVKSREGKASGLENMPLEILERIFWMSENVNLPLSNPLIGWLLSGESTLCATLLRAFEATWSFWFGQIVERDAVTTRCYHGDPVMQSRLLEFRWANVRIILKTWHIFIQQIARNPLVVQAPFSVQHPRIWGDPDVVTNTMVEDDGYLIDTDNPSQCFWHDYAAFRKVEELGTTLFHWFVHDRNRYTFYLVHKDTRIPDALLTSPCTDEVLQKLFWLVRGGARLASDQTWETTLQAFHHAVPMTLPDSGRINLTMIRLLDSLRAFRAWPAHVRFAEITRLTNNQPDHPGMDLPGPVWLAYEYTLQKLN